MKDQFLPNSLTEADFQNEESLEQVRNHIDRIDRQILELLARRMRLSGKIGTHKKEHGLMALQAIRYDEMIEQRSQWGTTLGLSEEFVKAILQAVHEESVRVQVELMYNQ